MKMRLSAFLVFAVLSISILSYGVNGSVFAEEHNVPPITLSTDSEIIGNGGIVTISGNIKNYDSSSITAGAITIVILNPEKNGRVGIDQFVPNSDGSFEFSFIAGGTYWKTNGDYTIDVRYGADKSEISINWSTYPYRPCTRLC